jgi:hypothetical protein
MGEKRQKMKEKKEKKKTPTEKQKKPINNLDFDSLECAVVDGKLVVRDRVLVLNRAWRTTIDSKITLCTVLRVVGDDVVLYDETLDQVFPFNLVKDVNICELLRVYDKTKIKKATTDASLNTLILGKFKHETKLDVGELVESLVNNKHSSDDIKSAVLDLINRDCLVMDDSAFVSLSETKSNN